ncbi:MAG: CvpA family protein [Synergistaceae bacterium]|nr:CvpA family protein [Synergistaceae bacterium]
MNATDIVLLAIGAFFIIRGLMKGLSGEFFSLVGTIGGFVCAIAYYEPFAAIFIEKFGASVHAATIISMLAIFFAIFFGCSLLDMVIKKVISKTNLTFTDKFFGGVVGLIKMYFLALTILVAGAVTTPMTGDAWMKNSRILSVVSLTWPFVGPPLERAGLMPDVAAIQEKAKEYIIRQAGSVLMGTSEDVIPETSNDVTP